MHKIIKHCPESEKITMVIKRLPNAKVYAVARTEQRQDIGIICQGATAEVYYNKSLSTSHYLQVTIY